MITPSPLRPGDKVAILSPATTVKDEYVSGAVERLRELGFQPVVMLHALGPADGSYASSAAERLADLRTAWADPQVRAVLCARGGYGAVHLLHKITDEELLADPKWLIGFSDISALHARLNAAGIASVHGSMAKHLASFDATNPATRALHDIITASAPCLDYSFKGHSYNRLGTARGVLRGGNLAVLSHLIATPWDMLSIAEDEEVILFIEDIGEAIYATERMMWQLYHTGALSRCRGLLIGSFTETKPDKNFADTHAMLHARLTEWLPQGVPVAFDVPIGHIDENMPVIEGARATLDVSAEEVSLKLEI